MKMRKEEYLIGFVRQAFDMNTFEDILERIEIKKNDYHRYGFGQVEHNAIMTFFDLAQEFEDIDDFYSLCVAIPKSFLNLDANLYLKNPKTNTMQLVTTTDDREYESKLLFSEEAGSFEYPYYTDKKSLVFPIYGKKYLLDQLPFKIKDNILGLLEIYPVEDRTLLNELFLQKFANRIGFNMHDKFIAEKNVEHLKFIRTLIADIEHNVIAPNIVYKLYLRRLRGKIMKNIAIETLLSDLCNKQGDSNTMENFLKELKEVNKGLTEELENIGKHYVNTSLFLETLFRRSHFDQGRLTLRTKLCNMKKEIVQPQLERYIGQFRNAGITIDDRLSGIPDEEIISVVDVGLMAQVYANLFSNALKYTEEVIMHWEEKRKYMSYGHEVIREFFGPGKDGIKYNVFNTGRHVPPEERTKIFEEGYRGSNTRARPGTGHGLTFVKNAVEIHGGVVGYEATPYGNNFYFIIPRSE
jgi:signal transduction histidine kinase